MNRENVLTFKLVDDLAMATVRGRLNPIDFLIDYKSFRIGPLLELFGLTRSNLKLGRFLETCDIWKTLSDVLVNKRYKILDSMNYTVGFISTNRNPLEPDQPAWVAFSHSFQKAAERLFPKKIAQGFTGAMIEIEENIHIHSERAVDGIVGYRVTSTEFEFSVMDSGIGILNSMNKSPDYDISDAGTAIKLALSDGQSSLRYQDPGRGYGFRNLFIGLANLNGELRFRSGDHSLTIEGTSVSLVTARLSQKTYTNGFAASVICRPKQE